MRKVLFLIAFLCACEESPDRDSGLPDADRSEAVDADAPGNADDADDAIDGGGNDADRFDADTPVDPGDEIVARPGTHTPFDLGSLTIAQARIPNFTTVGVEGGIPDTSDWPRVNAVDHGATPGDDSDDDSEAINAAIAAAENAHDQAVVVLPAGEYTITQPNLIQLASNVVLQGAGTDQTIIHSVMGGSASSGISIAGRGSDAEIALVGGLEQGSTMLSLEQAPAFTVGDFVLVQQDNDDRMVPEANHARGIGQVVKVIGISGTEVTIEPYLRVLLSASHNPRISRPEFVVNSGVEDLAIDFASVADVPVYRGSTFNFNYAVNSWLRNIKAENTYHVFVNMQRSARLSIVGSHFETMQKPDYTNAYAINFDTMVSDCLAGDNILEDVWVTAMFSHSCNGNVYAYNFHTSIREDHGIIHHGTYPFENLAEGNHAYRITNDCWWGSQGPRLTFFRNRASEIRTSRNGACQNHGEIVAEQANFLLNVANYYLSFPWCEYPEGCANFDDFNIELWAERNRYRDEFKGIDEPEPGNTLVDNVQGTSAPADWSGLEFPPSLYLNRRPDFWCDELPWPAVGADVDDDSALSMLPAERRHAGLACTRR